MLMQAIAALPFGSVADNEDDKAFARRLRSAIDDAEARGLIRTQNHFAELAGISSGHVSRLASGERGKRLDYHALKRAAEVLGVTLQWLAEGNEPRYAAKEERPMTVVELEQRYHAMSAVLRRAREDSTEEYLSTFSPQFKSSYQPSEREMLASWDTHVARQRGKRARGDVEAPKDI